MAGGILRGDTAEQSHSILARVQEQATHIPSKVGTIATCLTLAYASPAIAQDQNANPGTTETPQTVTVTVPSAEQPTASESQDDSAWLILLAAGTVMAVIAASSTPRR